MQIRSRALAIGALGLSAVGFVAVQPREAADVAVTAPLLTPLYAPAAEQVESHVVRSGQTLSQVFQEAALGRELASLLLAVREHIDPRRVMPNTAVLVRRWAEDGAPRSVDLAINADSTVRLKRESVGWYGELLVTPVEVDTLFLAGRLERGSSLYQSIVGHPELDIPRRDRDRIAYGLAEIYGWTLNFVTDMRPGDTFRLVYEREARPDGTTRAGRILAAEIVNGGTPLNAVFFDPRGTGGDYYDLEGRSLRLTFRRYPVQFARITSSFDWNRYHPVLKRSRPHVGTDFGTGHGTPILATADGTVGWAAWDGGYGNLVKINHGNGYETRYAHLSRFARGIRRGAQVKQGQVIGYSGSTGLATAAHLHYEFRRYDKPVNPVTVRLPAAPPVAKEHRAAFDRLAGTRTTLLASIPLASSESLPAN